jgi:hypothetical protein
MKRRGLLLKWMCATQCAVSALLFHCLVQAQTIESQDTRTLQDSRAQDGRQSPTVIPPGETERLKKLTEKAIVPEDTERSAASEAPENSTREAESPQRHTPATKRP